MKTLILALSVFASSVAFADSNCAVLEPDDQGSYNRVVAQQVVAADGNVVVLQQRGSDLVVAMISDGTTMIGVHDTTTGKTTYAAGGNGTATYFLAFNQGYAAVCVQK